MLIAKEYGYDHNLSGIVNDSSQLLESSISGNKKNGLSEFDMLLSFFKKTSPPQSSSQEAENSKDSNSSVLQEKNADVKEPSLKKKTAPKKEDVSLRKPKETLLDVKYISEFNNKVNHLLGKMKGTKHPSEDEARMIAGELQVLLLQFQKFSQHWHQEPHTLDPALSSEQGKSGKNQILNQLLQGMSSKLEMARGLLKEMEISSQSLTSKIISTQKGVDIRLTEVQSVDRELTKTLHHLKDLKKLSQEGQMVLQRTTTEQKPAGAAFSSVNFSSNLSHSWTHNSHHKGESSGFSLQLPIQKAGTSSGNFSFSGQSSSDSYRGEDHSHSQIMWNGTGISGGILGNKSLEAGSLSSENLGFEEKASLGREILSQIAQEMKGSIGKHESHFSISLKPEELGEVKILLDMKDGVIKSHIIVQNDLVRDLLKDRFEDMKNLFLHNGVNVSEFGLHTQEEFQNNQNSSIESIEGVFETQRHLAQQVKLHRIGNPGENHWAYEKMDDTQNEMKNFSIVI